MNKDTENLNTKNVGSSTRSAIGRHPVMVIVLLAFTVLGAAAGYYLLTEDWSVLRRIIAGAIGGLGAGFILTVSRMIGAWK